MLESKFLLPIICSRGYVLSEWGWCMYNKLLLDEPVTHGGSSSIQCCGTKWQANRATKLKGGRRSFNSCWLFFMCLVLWNTPSWIYGKFGVESSEDNLFICKQNLQNSTCSEIDVELTKRAIEDMHFDFCRETSLNFTYDQNTSTGYINYLLSNTLHGQVKVNFSKCVACCLTQYSKNITSKLDSEAERSFQKFMESTQRFNCTDDFYQCQNEDKDCKVCTLIFIVIFWSFMEVHTCWQMY